jgi:hypothetical protein
MLARKVRVASRRPRVFSVILRTAPRYLVVGEEGPLVGHFKHSTPVLSATPWRREMDGSLPLSISYR